MKPRHLLALLALFGATAIFGFGCDNDDAMDEAEAGSSSGEVGDDVDTAEDSVSDASDELDSSPIPEEPFRQLKDLWSGQIEGIEVSTTTLAAMNDEHKDEALAKMIEELKTKVAEMRKDLEAATNTSRQFLERDLPKRMEEAGTLLQRAQERMQDVVAAKAGIPR